MCALSKSNFYVSKKKKDSLVLSIRDFLGLLKNRTSSYTCSITLLYLTIGLMSLKQAHSFLFFLI